MPIGKDSITKRVAKQTEPAKQTEKNTAPELVATVGVAPAKTEKKAPAKKCAVKKTPANDGFKRVEVGNEMPYYLL